MTIEQSGTREIQGVPARGMKITSLGPEGEEDWVAKPIRETEPWVSDDLAAHMRNVDKDLRTGSEDRTELLAVNREEPLPVLFEIPMG
jgi:hypothetical protein